MEKQTIYKHDGRFEHTTLSEREKAHQKKNSEQNIRGENDQQT